MKRPAWPKPCARRSGWARCAGVAALAAALCGTSAAAANTIAADGAERATPWTSLAANDAERDFRFVVVGDRTGGARPGVFESAIPKVNLLEPAFVLSVGDLIEGNTLDQARLDREWDEFASIVAGLEAPFFHVAGNHDMSNAVMAETWRARFGPSYYRFVYKDVLFLVLNSELFGMVRDRATPVPGPWRQAEQMAFIERTLREFPNPRWTIVLVHQPLWDHAAGPRGDWPAVEALLGERNYTVFAGHFHRYVKHVRHDRKFITLATTGGGSSLRGARYGEFDHVALVTMTDAGPRIANLMLDGVHDENIVTEHARAALRPLAGSVYPFDPPAVVPVPVFAAAGEVFTHGVVAFEASNRGNSPLRVAYQVDPGATMRYEGASETLRLAPGARRRIEIALAAPGIAPRDLAPGRVLWSLSTNSADGPVKLNLVNALLPVAPLRLVSGPPPTVDGDLRDWRPEFRFTALHQGDVATGATAQTDISFSFALRESGGDIYLAAHVTDDSLLASTELGPRVQDALVLVVDSRPEPERSLNMPLFAAARGGHLARMAVAYLTLAPAARDAELAFLAESLAAVEWRTRRADGGYTAEAKVSGAFLDAAAGGRWQGARISLMAADWDEGETENRIPWHVPGSSATVLHWQPDRFGHAPAAGTGTFMRSAH